MVAVSAPIRYCSFIVAFITILSSEDDLGLVSYSIHGFLHIPALDAAAADHFESQNDSQELLHDTHDPSYRLMTVFLGATESNRKQKFCRLSR